MKEKGTALTVQPMDYWVEKLSKMDIDNLVKMRAHIANEIIVRNLKTLTMKELAVLHEKCKSRIANLELDTTEIEIGDDIC